MPSTIVVDCGSTGIAGVAVDVGSGELLASETLPNAADVTSAEDRVVGRSEWDAAAMASLAFRCFSRVREHLGPRAADVIGLSLTGQQHGVVLVDQTLTPCTPFISWQDQRGAEPYPGTTRTWVQEATDLLGPA